MRRRRTVGGVQHDTEIYGVPCLEPKKHKDSTKTQEWGDECWLCSVQWYEALPWVRSALDALYYEDDEALMTLLQVTEDARKKRRLTVVYRNCWGSLDANHQGYICELFGIETGESKNPDSYPYSRLTQKASPNLIIPIFRERICYEPQIRECPIYLEIVSSGYHREIQMHGLDSVEDISLSNLEYLFRVRDWLLDKEHQVNEDDKNEQDDDTEQWEAVRKGRGGDQSPEWLKELWSNDNLKKYASMVKDLAPKWLWVKSNGYDSHFFSTPQEWVIELRQRSEFAGLFGSYRRLTDDLLLRITDIGLSEADRQPIPLACLHAAHEFEIIDKYKTNQDRLPPVGTLRKKYLKGAALLSSSQTKQS